ncbi:hypothetical protein J6590_051194 [Homalodisca vitripennis]|nr:hypothetical protein J6590_051194 [Homalodisca vitripennis]
MKGSHYFAALRTASDVAMNDTDSVCPPHDYNCEFSSEALVDTNRTITLPRHYYCDTDSSWVRPAPSPLPSTYSISDEKWAQVGRQLELDALHEWRRYSGGSRPCCSTPILEDDFTPSEPFQSVPDPYGIQACITWDEVPTLQALSALQVCRRIKNKEELFIYFEESGPCGLIPTLKCMWHETGKCCCLRVSHTSVIRTYMYERREYDVAKYETGGIFAKLIEKYLKNKQEVSDYPSWCLT